MDARNKWETSEETLIKRPRISDEVVERLETAIRTGVYRIGETLPSERELMKRYGVGRPAVREALFTLNKRGIIEVCSGRRPRVCVPDASAILDDLSSMAKFFLAQPTGVTSFQQLREFLEVALTRDAARNATEAEIESLRRALAANKAAIGNREAFIQTDIAFHFVLAERTHNSIITSMHSAMTRWLYEQRVIALRVPGIEPVSYADHEAIYLAIAKHDPNDAELAMQQHLQEVARNYWAARTQDSATPRPSDH